MKLILTVLLIFGLLVSSEAWWRIRKPHNEFSRKFIHIFVGSLAAIWPFYLAWWQILSLSAAFVIVVLISKYLHIFQAIHSVERPTWGEILFAIAVGGLAFVTHQPWIYAVALLHMSLADGLAAIAGVTWGKRTQYKIFGHCKSVVGSATFLVVSVLLLTGFSQLSGTMLQPSVILGIAVMTMAIENLGVFGLDNLLVPLVVGVALEAIV